MSTLFSDHKSIYLQDGIIEYYPHFIEEDNQKILINILLEELDWRQDEIVMFGKKHLVPRLQAWYGDIGRKYAYSGIQLNPKPWNKTLQEIKNKIESKTSFKFNSVLANLYRSGKDSNGWHADNEKELGDNPTIASISLGASRYFHLKHRKDKSMKHKILLESGSLLIMRGAIQHHWLHQIAKTKKEIEPRVNLTFRWIVD